LRKLNFPFVAPRKMGFIGANLSRSFLVLVALLLTAQVALAEFNLTIIHTGTS
jgi:hypothetical protein